MDLSQYTTEQKEGGLRWLEQNINDPALIQEVMGDLNMSPTDLASLIQSKQTALPAVSNYSGGDDGTSTWTGAGVDPYNLWDSLYQSGAVINPNDPTEVGNWISFNSPNSPQEALQLGQSIGAPVNDPQFIQGVVSAYEANEARINNSGSGGTRAFLDSARPLAADIARFAAASTAAYFGAQGLGSAVEAVTAAGGGTAGGGTAAGGTAAGGTAAGGTAAGGGLTATQALSATSLINSFINSGGGNVTGLINDLLSLTNSSNNANLANSTARNWLDQSDPFRSQRQGYQDLLSSTYVPSNQVAGANMGTQLTNNQYQEDLTKAIGGTQFAAQQAAIGQNDPNFWTNQSWLSGIGDYAANATQRKLASQGYNYSGNTQQEVARTLRDTMAPYVIQGQQNQLGLMNAGNANINAVGGVIGQGQQNAIQGLNASTSATQNMGNLAGSQFNPSQAGPTLANLTGQATAANTQNNTNWGATIRDLASWFGSNTNLTNNDWSEAWTREP